MPLPRFSFLNKARPQFLKASQPRELPEKQEEFAQGSTQEERVNSDQLVAEAPTSPENAEDQNMVESPPPPIKDSKETNPGLPVRDSDHSNNESEQLDDSSTNGEQVQTGEATAEVSAIAIKDPEDPEGNALEEGEEETGSGIGGLQELFTRKSSGNPAVKALLKRHNPIETRELYNELKDLVLQLGITSSSED